MNVEELSLIGPVVDLSSVDAIHKKRLVAFINHFLIHTANFLNKFAKTCDSKLLQVHLRLQKLEASIILLESKLNSIPGLDIARPPEKEPLPKDLEVINTVTKPDAEIIEPVLPEVVEEPEEKQVDPALQKYVKMLQFGVPLPAVKLKMQQEGISIDQQNLILNS